MNRRNEVRVSCFETVERFIDTTHMSGAQGVNKTYGLLVIDGLGEVTMKETILDIHLTDEPRLCCGNDEDKAEPV